ncbi:MAG: DUF4365 domain-containing protein [Candidatus Electronema sp. VV]
MNSRYSPTEDLGIIATYRIVVKELGWIFRQQPIADVGVDAIIEQCENGNPTGRFIAVQIKSGAGNFYISKNKNRITYDASHIHYNYWLGLNIPIILVAHLPNSEETYWQHICKDNFKRWKLEIPKTQRFGKESKGKLTRILSEKDKRHFIFDVYCGVTPEENEFTAKVKTECISESAACAKNIVDTINAFTAKIKRACGNFEEYKTIDALQKPIYKLACVSGLSRDFNICSNRFEIEIQLFSELLPEGFYGYEQIILFEFLKSRTIFQQDCFPEIKSLSESLGKAANDVSSLKEGVVALGEYFFTCEEYNYSSIKSKHRLIEVIDLIIREFTEAKIMMLKLYERIQSKTNPNAPHHQPPSLP